MKEKEQRIAIAEACGWDCDPELSKDWTSRGQWATHYDVKGGDLVSLNMNVPDYLNDLNAMHEARKTLKGRQGEKYIFALVNSINGCYENAWWDLMAHEAFPVVNATAAQHAEAFLRALNLWKD